METLCVCDSMHLAVMSAPFVGMLVTSVSSRHCVGTVAMIVLVHRFQLPTFLHM